MFFKNNILYAGISNLAGLSCIKKYNIKNTGYLVQRITDGKVLGMSYELSKREKPEMFIEIDDGLDSSHYSKDNIIIANVHNEVGFEICRNIKNLYTSYEFIRIHDGTNMGNKIALGIDYSYLKTPRQDNSKYYFEVPIEEEIPQEEQNIEEN